MAERLPLVMPDDEGESLCARPGQADSHGGDAYESVPSAGTAAGCEGRVVVNLSAVCR